MIVKCSCGDKGCKTQISICTEGAFLTDKNGAECLMYLDANAKSQLAVGFKQSLMRMAFERAFVNLMLDFTKRLRITLED